MSAIRRLRYVEENYPEVLELADAFLATKNLRGFDWPKWCCLPLTVWAEMVELNCKTESRLETITRVYEIMAPATWRYSRGVYEFEPELYRDLLESEFSGKLPVQTLLSLPEWCVYIKTPFLSDAESDIDGFFAMLNLDTQTGRHEFRIFLDRVGAQDYLSSIPIFLEDCDLDESVERMLAASERNMRSHNFKFDRKGTRKKLQSCMQPAKHLLPLVIYLCMNPSEIENLTDPGQPLPPKPSPRKGRNRLRVTLPKKTTNYMVV